jgi:hypothetical protein
MSQGWTPANGLGRRARERAACATFVVVGDRCGTFRRHPRSRGHVITPVPARQGSGPVGEAARSVSPEGLSRGHDGTAVFARAEGPSPHRGTHHGDEARRGQSSSSTPVTRQLEDRLRARLAAGRDDSTVTPRRASRAAVADSENPDPVLHTIDAAPTTGRGAAARRELGRSAVQPRPTTLP